MKTIKIQLYIIFLRDIFKEVSLFVLIKTIHETQCVLCITLLFIKKKKTDLNILVVLIALVIIFKDQAIALVNKIWSTIRDNAGIVTG